MTLLNVDNETPMDCAEESIAEQVVINRILALFQSVAQKQGLLMHKTCFTHTHTSALTPFNSPHSLNSLIQPFNSPPPSVCHLIGISLVSLAEIKGQQRLDLLARAQQIVRSGGTRADLNERGDRGETMLHVAACHGYNDVVEYLLNNDADVDVTDDDGMTPLHAAVVWGNVDAVLSLVSAGADMHIEVSGSVALLLLPFISIHFFSPYRHRTCVVCCVLCLIFNSTPRAHVRVALAAVGCCTLPPFHSQTNAGETLADLVHVEDVKMKV